MDIMIIIDIDVEYNQHIFTTKTEQEDFREILPPKRNLERLPRKLRPTYFLCDCINSV